MDPFHGADYEIVVRGHVGRTVKTWFPAIDVTESETDETDETHVLAWFEDHAALQGFLAVTGELGLELLELRRIPDDD